MAGRRRALIVANGEYDNAGLQQLGSPAADADALAGVLADRAISDFEVRVVRNETAYAVQAEIEDLCEGERLAEGQPAQPSVFTSALVEGLRTGEADRDEDGWIALGELYDYLFDRVRERNPKQTPSRDIEMQGDLYLAKSRRRRIKPSPIPPDLRGAIEAENPFTRLGAVAELRRRLSSDDLPVAMGAFVALQAMASTDIEHVAAAAKAAQADVAVRADAPLVSFAAGVA